LKDTHVFQKKLSWLTFFEISISLFVILVAVYCLTYSGAYTTDDEHILTSRALSLAFDHNVNDTRIYGNSRVYALSNLNGVWADQALNIEPAQVVVGSIFARLAVFLNVGRIQSLFLLNIWVMALTALVLFGGALILGYSSATGFVLALLFGLGTIAWPYTRTYFRDPLAMLFLVSAWVCMSAIKSGNPAFQSRNIRWAAWIGLIIFLVAGILAKNTITIAIPVLFGELVIHNGSKIRAMVSRNLSFKQNWKTWLFIAGFLFVLMLVWAVVLPRFGLLARFSLTYYISLIRFFLSSPHPNFLSALTGPFVSPGKSIFLYSPVLLLAIVALFCHFRRAWSAWLYLVLLIIAQALFYDQIWWGAINWGLRYILPAIPPLILASAPIVESWMKSKRGRISLIASGSISVLAQLIGILAPLRQYFIEMYAASPPISEKATIWTFKYSALAWHLNWILRGGSIDLTVSRVGLASLPVVLGVVIIIAVAFLGLFRFSRWWISVASLGLVLGLMILMVASYGRDPAFYGTRADLQAANEQISQEYNQGDLVLIKSYGSPAWYYFMNWGDPQIQWTSLPFYFPLPNLIDRFNLTHDPEIVLDEISLALFNKVQGSYNRVWLVVPADSPGTNLNMEVTWLEKISSSFNTWSFEGEGMQTKLYLFEVK
jgi:hypothetical protein